jgi:hypothetical protein
MAIFTDATVSDVSVTVDDGKGRSASITFEKDCAVFHRARPSQGKKARIPYADLLDLALKHNPRFFEKVAR